MMIFCYDITSRLLSDMQGQLSDPGTLGVEQYDKVLIVHILSTAPHNRPTDNAFDDGYLN